MSAKLEDFSQEFLREHEERSLRALDAVGRLIKTNFRRRLNRAYPPASKPGEYPRKRTGKGRDAVSYDVEDEPKIELFVGLEPEGKHLEILREKFDRKGLDDTIEILGERIVEAFIKAYQK
jgi:hypothetical protein